MYGGQQVQTRNNGQKRIHKQETAANNEMKTNKPWKQIQQKNAAFTEMMQTKYNTQILMWELKDGQQ